MVTAFFISENWLKTKTPLNQHCDIALIVPWIGVAQDLACQRVLGTALYTRLMAGIVANDLNTNETALIELVRPALAYYTVAYALPFVHAQIRNAGVVKTKNETIESVTKAEGLLSHLREADSRMCIRCSSVGTRPVFLSDISLLASSVWVLPVKPMVGLCPICAAD